MRRKNWIGILVAIAGVLVSASIAFAQIPMHHFDCQECHTATFSPGSLTNNICLKCHNRTLPQVWTFNDPARQGTSPQNSFMVEDASDALGSATQKSVSATNQTSHFWGGSVVKPEAGAQTPSSLFSEVMGGALNTSRGLVTCSQCHDPHAFKDTGNAKLLLNTSAATPTVDGLCLDCHRSWNLSNTQGLTTHPMNVDLATAPGNVPDANNDPTDKYYDTPDNSAVTNGTVALVNGKVSCSTCHGVHGVDSDGNTPDSIGTMNTGDGLLLKHNGPGKETPDTSICQSCHKYKGHGNALTGNPIACLTCHGGHEYDAAGAPNYYMLKKQITLDTTAIRTPGAVSDTVFLNYTDNSLPNYSDGTGNGGLCLSCHDYPAGHPTQSNANCADCHSHDANNGSFGPGCGSCHGFAPYVNDDGSTTQGGYAHATTKTANNYFTSGVFKDESKSPHATHANGSGNYAYSCDDCHGTNAGPNQTAAHDQGSFQNVFQLADGGTANLPALPKAGGLTPNYNVAGAGTCSAVYCHSNGNPIGGTIQTANVDWDLGIGTIFTPGNTADNECQQCHGNDQASMDVTGKDNSTAHQQHLGAGPMLGKTFDCSVCHSTVAASNTALLGSAIGGDHVNGTKEVSFDGTFSLGVGTLGGGSYGSATCSVYCHSNGKTGSESSPNWTVPTSGQCGSCHQVNATGDTGAALTGAHAKHVFDASGPQLSCDDCHGTNAATGKHANHLNGDIDAPTQVTCNGCHGASAGVTTGPDREPVWTDTATVDCETCHTGIAIAVVNTKTAPAQNSFGTLGHGKPSITGPACTGCHDTSAGKHFDATSGDPQLTGAVVADDAFCQTCHNGTAAHFTASASTNANQCAYCHDPHGNGVGVGFDAMLLTSVGPTGAKAPSAVTGFTDKTVASSYWNASKTGICQVCHVATGGTGGIAHYNRTDAPDGHNSTTVCTTCHNHNDPVVAFKASANDCEGCHAGTMATNGHPAHVNKNGTVTTIEGDLSDCAACHGAQVNGADPYTLAGGGGGMHQDGTVDFATGIADGGTGTALTCSAACHNTASGVTAVWDSGTIACDACHGQPPADGGGDGLAHSKHVALSGVDCTTCHGGPMPTDQTHVTQGTGNDLAILQNMAVALPDEANIAEASWNATNNTCNNAACHDPSGDGHSADWTASTSSCVLCHNNDVASGSPMASGSHTGHVNNATELGVTFTCDRCHTDPAGVMAHRNGTVDVLATLNYDLPARPGSCESLICHQTGKDVEEPSPVWGTTGSDCTICHNSPAASGDHTYHWAADRQANGLECKTCHASTVANNTTILTGGGLHLDGSNTDVVTSGNYNASPVSVTYNSAANPSTCAASCHSIPTTVRPWAPPTSCEACHGDLSYIGGAHDKHILGVTGTPGDIDADKSECAICHTGADTYTLSQAGNHQNGTVDTAAGISNTNCTSACHASAAAGDGDWNDANGLNCTACHNQSGTNDGVMANAAPGVSHTGHLTAGMTCSDCHGTVDAAGTSPLTHNHAKTLTNDASKLQTRGKDFINPNGTDVAVDDSAFNGGTSSFNNSNVTTDAGNSCSNALCHNPSGAAVNPQAKSVDWDVDVADCATCHGDDGTTGLITTGSHSNHLNATAKFGLTITCDRCHPTNATNTHFIGTVGATTLDKLNKAVQFGGTVITTEYTGDAAIPNVGVGTCSTNKCHNNGLGAAPVASYTWGTAVTTDCQTCHNDPPNIGRHATHLGNANLYGPHNGTSTWTCGDCHDANSAADQASQTMTGRTNHINGSINFNDGNAITNHGGIFGAGSDISTDTTITSCNNCHGGQTAADLAKAQWTTTNRLACESCHGDYTVANSAFDGTGIAAPAEAGTNYDTYGHGKANTPAGAIGGSKTVSQACTACHDNTSGHISGTGGDATRLLKFGTAPTEVDFASDPNGFCNYCHTGLANSNVHYSNNQTANGNSIDGLTCVTCHDQHGQGAQDAMISSNIGGNAVAGFADRSARASYANASNNGVCQVCHDPNAPDSVQHFNQTTNETTHNSGVCTTCHKHTDNPIFAPSGCNGCHGGGTSGATTSNYWPDGSNANVENTAGRHLKHMNMLSLRAYGVTATALLDDANADSKQKTLCAYCHTTPGQDADHGNPTNLPAEVNSMAQLWDGTADDATYDNVADTCSSVNCHNGKTTTNNTYGWYDAGASTCTMCHTAGQLGANPTTGLHTVTAAGVQVHDASLGNGCTECHNAMPAQGNQTSNTHIDGSWSADGSSNPDRGITVSGNIAAFTEAAVGTSDSCAANCHSDNGNWERLWSTDADSTSTSLGTTRCDVCHGQLNKWRAGMSVNHDLAKINDGTHSDCTQCHVAPTSPYDFATMHEDGSVQVNNNASMNYNATTGTCSVATCHGSTTPEHGPGASTIFPEDLIIGADVSCNSCHDSAGGFTGQRAGHAKHVIRVASSTADYGDTNIYSTATGYSFGCGTCHPANADFSTKHNNSVVDITLNNTLGGPIHPLNGVNDDVSGYSQADTVPGDGGSTTCSAAYCHSDAAGTYQTTPDWYGGAFPTPQADGTNDYCANCHGNQPTTSSHAKHVIGIHSDDIYSGTVDKVSAAGAAGTGAGHGDINTALTINCNMCHANTLTQWRNDYNTACRACHAGEGNQITANDVDLKMNFHVNGVKDVEFATVDPIRSKAQVRDNLADATELANNWQRVNGYKAAVDSHDATITSPPLNTTTMWNGTSKNCTVACHNQNLVTWGATGTSCNLCHTQLPK